MSHESWADESALADMRRRNIDIDLSRSILEAFNAGEYDRFQPIAVTDIPTVDGSSVIDFTDVRTIDFPADVATERLATLLPAKAVDAALCWGTVESGRLRLDRNGLERLGYLLLPTVSYGVLNGGSASSYADTHKNRGFSGELFDLLGDEFSNLAATVADRPKGLAPAYVDHGGTHGASFLQLKMRAVLIATIKSRAVYRSAGIDWPADIDPLSPLFQMSSDTTHDALADAYAVYPDDPLLSSLISATGSNPTGVLDAVQPLICAFTHSSEGLPKRVFTHAHGNAGETLPMPGGHGQCFAVLAEIFRSLLKSGKRFVTIGNVDNLGYLVDPCEVAVLALSGKQAGFDFSFRTPVDVKGGILVRDQHGRLNCADIGPAISKDDVARAESAGKPILFNTAAGIFDLDYLVENLDRIVTDLPVRFSDQDKDAGRYSQAEQVTWEVLGMLDDFVVFSVEKWRRFLAAKLLLETLMTSGVHLDDPRYPTSDDPVHDLRSTARHLNRGLSALLAGPYGMKETGGAWAPVPTETIVAESETEGV